MWQIRCGWVGCVAFSCGLLWQFRIVGVSMGQFRSGPVSCGR